MIVEKIKSISVVTILRVFSPRAQLHCCIKLFINKVFVCLEKLSHIKPMRINPQKNDIVQKYITVIFIF